MPHLDRPVETSNHSALIQAIAARRDRAAFVVLFGHFAPRVKAWMIRAGTPPVMAEELAQETMIVVWQKAALFDPIKASAATWIFTIARNQRIDALRRERHPSELTPDLSHEPEPPFPADYIFTRAEEEKRLRSALSQLPAEQAEIIHKAFFEEKPHAQIERELGIPLGTVKSRLRLAIRRLRSAFGNQA